MSHRSGQHSNARGCTRRRESAASLRPRSVAELGAPPRDVAPQFAVHGVIEGRLFVALEGGAPQLTGPLGGVAAAVARPAIEVLGRGEQRPVEALAEALEGMRRAEEVAARPDLDVGVEGQTGLIDLQRGELVAQLAQQLAEALAGIALVQLIRPGCPVVFGSFLSNTDMQSGSPSFGTPESAIGVLATGQIARRYGLPWRGGGAMNASQTVDAQAAYEALMLSLIHI